MENADNYNAWPDFLEWQTYFHQAVPGSRRGFTGGLLAAKILIVEDNEMNRDMLSRRLRRREFEIEIALDGPQGLEMARSFLPDLILMDLSLPEIDGWEVTRRLKSEPATRHIPVIALTAHAMVSDRERALAVGCDEYDTKPIEFPRLLAKIESLLPAAVRA
jgi:CheY-like chemotaxis protein